MGVAVHRAGKRALMKRKRRVQPSLVSLDFFGRKKRFAVEAEEARFGKTTVL